MRRLSAYSYALSLFAVPALLALTAYAKPKQNTARPKEAPVDFRKEVEPILEASCLICHNGANKKESGFSIESVETLFKGGSTYGNRIIVPGKPQESMLIGYLRGKGVTQMPLGAPPLSEGQIQRIEEWIQQGAKAEMPPPGWPFARPVLPAIPTVKNASWIKTPIDAFIMEKMEAKGLTPAAPAEKTVLLRRVYMDLVGMPPSLTEALQFMSDNSADAYEKLVDRLLADPRYGERWGRHWLDLVRYADSDGTEQDRTRPRMWRYRDYVVRSLNQDKPYDQFLKEQLAGDELYPNNLDASIATTYLRLAPGEDMRLNEDRTQRHNVLVDVTDNTCAVTLGLTMGCTRCHDHKIDRKLHQADYYRLYSFFAGLQFVDNPLLNGGNDPETKKRLYTDTVAMIQPLKDERKEMRERFKAMVMAEKMQKEPEKKPRVNEFEIDRKIDEDPQDKARRLFLDAEIAKYSSIIDGYEPSLTTVREVQEAPKTYFMKRGELYDLDYQREMKPGFPAVFNDGKYINAKLAVLPAKPRGARRTTLANWIASAENPMTAKVMVNRIWHYHFGRGIVATPSDFGNNGDIPSHFELLNWLAVQFSQAESSDPNACGWKLKKMHRMILLSNTYRQSSKYSPENVAIDPENRYLWRMNRLRLEGEAVRDSLLAVSGRLNLEMGGPGVFPPLTEEEMEGEARNRWGKSSEQDSNRRSLYIFQRRTVPYPIIDAYDGPDAMQSCPVRSRTTVVPQVLTLFNSQFGRDLAGFFARKVQKMKEENNMDAIDIAYWLAFTRRPTEKQKARAERFLFEQSQRYSFEGGMKTRDMKALTDFCLVLLNSNEFLYLD